MKRYAIGVILLATLSVSSCKLLNKLTQFYVNYSTSYTYPAGLPANIPVINTPDVETNVQQQFKNNNTNADLVQSVKLDQLELVITPEGQQTFRFLKEVDIYIFALGQPETKIASKSNIDNNVGSRIMLDVTDAELRNYLAADSFGLRIRSVTDETVISGVTATANAKFFVDAKILGI